VTRSDLGFAVALTVLGLVEALAGWTGEAEPWWHLWTVPWAMSAVAVRRAQPWLAVAMLTFAMTTQAALGSDLPGGWSEGVATVVVVYSFGAHRALRPGLALLAAAALGQGTVILLAGDARVGNFVYLATVLVVAWLAGRGRRLAFERSELIAERRVSQERARIARELHDVVAHHVSAIVVQTGAERRSLPDGAAADVLADVERRGRETLTELRRLLGVLRLDDATAAPLAPQPRLADLPHLVRQMGDQGLDVSWEATGAPASIDEGMELTIYRVVQESLTNAGKHAGEPSVSVRLHWLPRQVQVEILSRGEATRRHVPGSGFGLRAMAERVHAYGGEFSARRTSEGFLVRALLPVEAS
jgi:signal transduction histidine kinase